MLCSVIGNYNQEIEADIKVNQQLTDAGEKVYKEGASDQVFEVDVGNYNQEIEADVGESKVGAGACD